MSDYKSYSASPKCQYFKCVRVVGCTLKQGGVFTADTWH